MKDFVLNRVYLLTLALAFAVMALISPARAWAALTWSINRAIAQRAKV